MPTLFKLRRVREIVDMASGAALCALCKDVTSGTSSRGDGEVVDARN